MSDRLIHNAGEERQRRRQEQQDAQAAAEAMDLITGLSVPDHGGLLPEPVDSEQAIEEQQKTASLERDIFDDPVRRKMTSHIKALPDVERQRLISLATPRIVEPYFKHIPHPPQQVFLSLNSIEEVMYGGAAGGGKALALDTPLVTPTGWTTMGDVQPGDYVHNEQGVPTRVLAKSEVMYNHKCYDVFFSDGTKITADAEHLWSVVNTNRRVPVVKTTEQIASNLTTPAGRRKWAVPMTAPIEGEHQQFCIDPYVFGLWLGDGDTRRGYITIGLDDTELVWQMKECGEELTQLSDTHYRVEGLSERLRQIGVLGTYRNPNPKRIPQVYLRASVQQRRALLQGIVDSDGYVDGDVEVCWTSRGLTDDLLELLFSLGIKAQAHESRATLNGKDCGPRWRVKWMTDIQSARLDRKHRAQKRTGFRGTHDMRYIVAVQAVSSVPVQCIKVDSPSHLYLAGREMVPTHNSDALLMSALQYVDVPGYSALILRRTWPDLNAPGAILDRARSWLEDTPARQKDGGRIWEFPSGARIQFGYVQHEKDRTKFQSAEYQFVGFDELTHFPQSIYSYLFSRVRRPTVSCLNCGTSIKQVLYKKDSQHYWTHNDAHARQTCRGIMPDPKIVAQYQPAESDGMTLFDVPLRVRSATNPGGVGHLWVKSHFIDERTKKPDAVFIPARLKDNPSLDRKSYEKNLQHLLPVDRERLLNGDWDVEEEGSMFARHWLKPVNIAPAQPTSCVRFWDLASTEGGGDWTVGAKVSLSTEGQWFIEDIVRLQGSPLTVEKTIYHTAMLDGSGIPIRMEQEPGSAGVNSISHYKRNVLTGFNFDGIRATGDKVTRATALSSASESGNVFIVLGDWNRDFLDELALFPHGAHDDQVDAVAGAVNQISFGRRTRLLV